MLPIEDTPPIELEVEIEGGQLVDKMCDRFQFIYYPAFYSVKLSFSIPSNQ
jgi:hypothetical protein